MLCTLFLNGVLKIFQFNKSTLIYKYITKVSLSGPDRKSIQHAGHLPIFNGGICAYKDTFLIQYQESAELIKIENRGTVNETVQKIELWNFEPKKVDFFSTSRQRAMTSVEPDEEVKMNFEEQERPARMTLTEAAFVSQG
jgi:hypothetical protein